MRIIDADALIRAIKNDTDLLAYEKIYCIKNAREAPTLDYKDLIPQGEWIAYPSEHDMKCSVCGMEYSKDRMPTVVGFCPNPNCGARMK